MCAKSGKEADILVVEGNPLENVLDLMKVKAVFKAGDRIC
jgi:imidazolonepropionase-like amidohydrolase